MQNSFSQNQDGGNEPVFFCKNCHSLHILIDETLADSEWDGSYCGCCFSTNIGECSIEEWLEEEHRRKVKRLEIEWNK